MHAVEEHDGQDGQRVDHVAHQAGDDGGGDQDRDDRLEELAEESPPHRGGRRLLELVRPEPGPTRLDLRCTKPSLGIDGETSDNLLGRHYVTQRRWRGSLGCRRFTRPTCSGHGIVTPPSEDGDGPASHVPQEPASHSWNKRQVRGGQ